MKVEIKNTSDTRKVATVSFAADEVAKEEKEVLQLFAEHAKIPGFRPGKAPAQVIRTRFGEKIKEEWLNRLSAAARDAVLDLDELRVHQLLKIEPGEILVEAPLDVVVTLDVEPDFDLPEYENFKVEVASDDPEDKDIEDLLESWRQQRANFAVVERAVEKGDYVKCSYDGTIDGQSVGELVPDKPIFGKQANTWEEAGAENGIGIPAVIEGLIGMKAGDSKSCEADFPEDFEDPRLAGKQALYEVEVHEVRHKELPAEDDETFLKSMEVENVDALREKAEVEAKNQRERANENAKRRQVREQLMEDVEIELPQASIEAETQEIFRSMVDENLRRGVGQEDLESHRDEMYERAGVGARETVKLRIILGRIAEKEELEVSKEELTQVIATQAMMSGTDPQEHFNALQQDRARLAHLHRQVLFDKTLALLTQKASVSIKDENPEKDHDDES